MSGVYDLDGKCVACGEFHPCSCEYETLLNNEQGQPMDSDDLPFWWWHK